MTVSTLRASSAGFCLRMAAAAILCTGSVALAVSPAAADGDEWAQRFISGIKAASAPVASSRAVRVASLGPYVPVTASPPAISTEESVVDTRPGSTRQARNANSRADRTSRQRQTRNRSGNSTRYDSSGNFGDVVMRPGRSLSGGSVTWIANAGCLNGSLRAVVNAVASRFGPVTVNSTRRSGSHNRRIGGASRSYHLSGNAVDFRVRSNTSAVFAFLRSHGNVGGIKHYGGGLFHIDNGPRRSW